MRKRKSLVILVLLLAVALGASLASWAATTSSGSLSITVASGNGVTDGSVAGVTTLSSNVTGLVGKSAQVQRGVTFRKITLPTSNYSNRLLVEFWLLSADQVGQVLNNPRAFIKTQLWWLDTDQTAGGGSSDCASTRLSITDSGTKYVCPDTGDQAYKYITAANAGGLIRSTKTGQTVFYILGEITVPGGVPQGQQSQLSTLTYWANVSFR
ncbi:MAG: hypothetical protein HY680_11675 [Chloroflexi bacterium]|nr:hypothetical protein [Chloroflexota bacterium]